VGSRPHIPTGAQLLARLFELQPPPSLSPDALFALADTARTARPEVCVLLRLCVQDSELSMLCVCCLQSFLDFFPAGG
jgi:hypothetical protein